MPYIHNSITCIYKCLSTIFESSMQYNMRIYLHVYITLLYTLAVLRKI